MANGGDIALFYEEFKRVKPPAGIMFHAFFIHVVQVGALAPVCAHGDEAAGWDFDVDRNPLVQNFGCEDIVTVFG